jgi:hypothetical protein
MLAFISIVSQESWQAQLSIRTTFTFGEVSDMVERHRACRPTSIELLSSIDSAPSIHGRNVSSVKTRSSYLANNSPNSPLTRVGLSWTECTTCTPSNPLGSQ